VASIEFGNTWWGKKWLDTLSGTDYSNRLPRGKRYARNGSVRKVNVTGTKVSASVQGSRKRPYEVRISLPKFSVKDKRSVVDAVTQNPYFLSQLLIRRLPPLLFDEFQKQGVPLFPESWDDIKANCSCPDWAFCCKHIAAVIYLIANEVDKNPFLLFELHNFDIFAALAKQDLLVEPHSNPAITAAQQLIVKTVPAKGEALSREERDRLFDRLDFSQIPPVRDELLSLLGHGPLGQGAEILGPAHDLGNSRVAGATQRPERRRAGSAVTYICRYFIGGERGFEAVPPDLDRYRGNIRHGAKPPSAAVVRDAVRNTAQRNPFP